MSDSNGVRSQVPLWHRCAVCGRVRCGGPHWRCRSGYRPRAAAGKSRRGLTPRGGTFDGNGQRALVAFGIAAEYDSSRPSPDRGPLHTAEPGSVCATRTRSSKRASARRATMCSPSSRREAIHATRCPACMLRCQPNPRHASWVSDACLVRQASRGGAGGLVHGRRAM
jgi:hypothetical protein